MLKLSIEEIAASRMTFQEITAEFGEETAIQVGVIRDRDTTELGQDWFQRARPATEVVPHVVERWRRTRGKQKAPTKEAVSIRLDKDVLAHYRASGRGWQSRINETLRKYSVDPKPEAPEEPGAEPQR